MMKQAPAAAQQRDVWTDLLKAAVALGVLARVVQYLWRRSYWHDEGYLVLNVTSLTYRQLVGPLPHAQSAPPAFLVAQKAMFDALGPSEYVLRAIPLLFGLAAIVLMAVLARRSLGRLGAACAVALFALSDRLIAHAVEAKQYSGDVFFALLLLLIATNDRRSEVRRLLAASVVAAAALWMSHPVVFVFGGVALALLPALVRRPAGARGMVVFAVGCAPAVASFALLYALSIRHQEVGDLYAYWADRFPDWGRPWLLPVWLIEQLIDFCRYPYEIGGTIVFALACCGGWALWRNGRRQWLGMLLAPVGLTLLASLVGRYPFGGSRVTLFLAPAMFLLAGHGIEWLWDRVAATTWREAGIALPIILLGIGLAQVLYHLAVPRHRGHIRPAVEYVRTHRRPGEPVYMIGEPTPFRCYWREPGLPRELTAEAATEIREMRFWIVYGYGNEDDAHRRGLLMEQIGRTVAPVTDTFGVTGGAAYRFDRTAAAAAPATSPASPATRP